MSLALFRPALKRQLCLPCLHSHLKQYLVSVHRAQSTAAQNAVPYSSHTTVASGSHHETSLDSERGPKAKRKKKDASKPRLQESPPRNLLEESKIQSYLDHIAETSSTVTLEDINRLRPRGYPDVGSQEFENQYVILVDKLCRSFSKKQLGHFAEMLEVESFRRASTKRLYAVQIIEGAWGWPSLTEIQKSRRDWTEVHEETFNLNPRQAFLILGKDGSELHSLSVQHNVHIGFCSRPLCLKVEGVRGAVEQLSKHILALNTDILEEFYNLNTEESIPDRLLQRVSRRSGAFTERFGEGQIRISYRKSDPRPAFVAKRLVTNALCDMENTSEQPILVYIPPGTPDSTPSPLTMFPSSYALYPFMSFHSLPWTTEASGAFRARKVAEWIGIDSVEDVQKSGGLELGRGRVLDMSQQDADVQLKLLERLPNRVEGSSRVISASLGHVLLSPPKLSQVSLAPPLKGSWPISKLLNWVREEHVDRSFTTFLPTLVLDSTPRSQQLLHRLIFEAQSTVSSNEDQRATRTMKVEIVLPSKPDLDLSNTTTSTTTSGETAEGSSRSGVGIDSLLPHTCRVGHISIVDLILPDRPMDIRFSAFDSSPVSVDLWPTVLQDYLGNLSAFFTNGEPDAAPPNTPLILQYGGVDFRLRSSLTVRQNQADVSVRGNEFSAVTESVLDPEINEKATLCKITCHEPFDEASWRTFLGRCDHLSATRKEVYKPRFMEDITV